MVLLPELHKFFTPTSEENVKAFSRVSDNIFIIVQLYDPRKSSATC